MWLYVLFGTVQSLVATEHVSLPAYYSVSYRTFNEAFLQDSQASLTWPKEAIADLLYKADVLHAQYHTSKAIPLWNRVFQTYQHAALPSEEVLVQAAHAHYAYAAALWTEQQYKKAFEAAQNAVRLFPQYFPNTHTYPPKTLAFFNKAKHALKHSPCTNLTFHTSQHGHVTIDGHLPQPVTDTVTVCLPSGVYKAAIKTSTGVSFSKTVVLKTQPQHVFFHPDTDARVQIQSTDVLLACSDTCQEDLNRISERTHLTPPTPYAPVVARLAAPVATTPTQPNKAHLLWPGGIAQFTQGRVVSGWAWASATAGITAWHVSALIRHAHNHKEHTRYERNISAGLVYTTLLLAPLEAWLHHRFFTHTTQHETPAAQDPSF